MGGGVEKSIPRGPRYTQYKLKGLARSPYETLF